MVCSGAAANREPDPARPLPPPPLGERDALFLDFDGTIVDLAISPDAVRVPAELPGLLDTLSTRLAGAVAIVSGRRIADLAWRLAPFAGAIAGQHGIEIRRGDGRVSHASAEPLARPIHRSLAAFAARHDGLILEDKGSTMALHYRLAPGLGERCRAAARDAVRASGGSLRAIEGKMVVELVPGAIGKGRAIAVLLAEPPFSGRVPVCVGDDSTDEDGFAMVDGLGGVSVRVGEGASSARFRLAAVGDVLAWLTRSCRR